MPWIKHKEEFERISKSFVHGHLYRRVGGKFVRERFGMTKDQFEKFEAIDVIRQVAFEKPLILTCEDCRLELKAMYRVNDALWLSVAKEKDVLCLQCFEKRIGRHVTFEDLTENEIKNVVRLGAYILQNQTK